MTKSALKKTQILIKTIHAYNQCIYIYIYTLSHTHTHTHARAHPSAHLYVETFLSRKQGFAVIETQLTDSSVLTCWYLRPCNAVNM